MNNMMKMVLLGTAVMFAGAMVGFFTIKSQASTCFDEAELTFDLIEEEVTAEDDELLQDPAFIWGFLANAVDETGGRLGAVEWQFSWEKSYGFELPSGGTSLKTKEDIEYLKNWTTSDAGTLDGLPRKGSAGVGAVQWSFERRVTYCEILEGIISDEENITEEELRQADAQMFLYELRTNESFLKNIKSYLPANPTVSDYAAAICWCYVGNGGDEMITRRRTNASCFMTYWEEARKEEIVSKLSRKGDKGATL